MPNELLQLHYSCQIDLTRCGLSEAVIGRLREAVQSGYYHGPRISFSMYHAHSQQEEERTIEESLKGLCGLIDEAPEEFPALAVPQHEKSYRSWLNRLFWTADLKDKGESQREVANKIIEYLRLANTDEKFREVFFETIEGASATCGDRVSLSLLHLGIQRQIAICDINDVHKLANLLTRGTWALSLLEQCARNKIPELQFFDEISVYLGYPIMLKERLALPIDVKNMLYFSCGGLTDQDLNTAEAFVKEHLDNPEAQCEFLIEQPTWKKALEHRYALRVAQLERIRARVLDKPDANAVAIQKEYNQGLIKLTKEALASKEKPAKPPARLSQARATRH